MHNFEVGDIVHSISDYYVKTNTYSICEVVYVLNPNSMEVKLIGYDDDCPSDKFHADCIGKKYIVKSKHFILVKANPLYIADEEELESLFE